LYIQKGTVKLSVLSHTGKEAVVALLGPGDFFGERACAEMHRHAPPIGACCGVES
jgi:CRP-like cAMP-binding protein